MHLCQSCGACCAAMRVVFHERERDSHGGTVPAELTLHDGDERVVMRGTQKERPRCVALEGEVGKGCRCTIYELRSENCRAFEASWERGEHNPYCDNARAMHGLAPLKQEDWRI